MPKGLQCPLYSLRRSDGAIRALIPPTLPNLHTKRTVRLVNCQRDGDTRSPWGRDTPCRIFSGSTLTTAAR
jgi:hypothetical protein